MPRRTVRAPEPRGRMPAPELPEQQAWAHRAWRPAWVLHDRAWDRPAQRRLREPPRVRSPQPGKPEPQEPQGPLPREPASQRPTWARRRALGRRRAWVHPDGDRQQAWALLRQQPRRRARPRKSHGPGERPGPRWWNWRSGRIRPSPSGDSAVSCSRLRALLRARRPGPWPRFSSICRPGESSDLRQYWAVLIAECSSVTHQRQTRFRFSCVAPRAGVLAVVRSSCVDGSSCPTSYVSM